MERSHSIEESSWGFFLACIGSVTATSLALYSIISLAFIQLPPHIFASCQLGPGLFNITLFTLSAVFLVILSIYLHRERSHKLTLSRATCYFKMLRTMLGPLMLSLTLIALKFWKYIVYPCNIVYNEEQQAISYNRSSVNMAVVPAGALIFSLFVSFIICVLIAINRIKRRFHSHSHWVTNNLQSTNQYLRQRIRNAFTSEQYQDVTLTEALLARP